nr:aminotransferase class V-fold PLP-dependent enzyme [Rubrimonas cliftonensis]
MDAADPLADRRALFRLPEDVVYLDGNSLGALPLAAERRIAEAVSGEWGESLIRSWNAHGWLDLPARTGDRIARLIGAAPGSTLCCDSTSINIFKLLAAALAMRPGRDVILSERGNFPTDLHVAEGLLGLIGRGRLHLVARADIAGALGPEVAVAMLTQVDYRSGCRLDLDETTRAVHDAGAVMLWDLAHSAGAFRVDLATSRAEFAVGCGYKYLNGGPGAPAFAYVRPDLADDVAPALSGWMGHAAPFDFEPGYRPAPGVDRLRVGTPPILSMTALHAALEAFEGVDMAQVEAKGRALVDFFIAEVERLAPPGALSLVSPRDGARRGPQAAFATPNGYAVMQTLIADGVIGDFRAPDILRFGFAPLYTRFVDAAQAAALLADILATGRWDRPGNHVRAAVT